MIVNSLPCAYTTEALRADASWDQAAAQQMMQAKVATRRVAVNLGPFGLEYDSQNVMYEPRSSSLDTDFGQELELFRLSQHLAPFQPVGASVQNASLQRQGAQAYAAQASNARQPGPMISIVV